MAEQACPTLQIDNDRVRVTEWRFPPGAAPDTIGMKWTT